MVNSQAPAYQAESDATLDFDAIIIGAGVSGLYQLYKLRELGLKTLVLEDGSNVGGTWYWNRYPGARFNSESWTYGYSFSDELLQEWNWEEHFASAPETERYLNYVADKFDLRRDIQFRSRVSAAQYNEETRGWDVTLEDDRRYHSRFLITAIGVLSAPTLPRISGVDTFKGQSCHTAHWPKEQVNFEGKRVAVIGTGATAVQTIQTIAKEVGHLTVFQRTPNWCAPLHNSRITDEQMRQIRDRYAEIFARCHETPGCFIHSPDPRSALEVTARGTRGVLRETLRRARLRHLAGQLPRYPGGSRGQCADLRFRCAQDPSAREGPGGGREIDPEQITASAPAACRSRRTITRSTISRTSRWSTSTKRRSSASRRPESRPAMPSTNST